MLIFLSSFNFSMSKDDFMVLTHGKKIVYTQDYDNINIIDHFSKFNGYLRNLTNWNIFDKLQILYSCINHSCIFTILLVNSVKDRIELK